MFLGRVDAGEGNVVEGDAAEGGEEREESDSSGDMYDSDKLESPHVSGDESKVHSSHKDVTKRISFDHTNMNNPTLIVENTFHSAVKFRKAVRQYN